MNIQYFINSLPILFKGMFGIFLALLAVYGVAAGLSRFTSNDKNE